MDPALRAPLCCFAMRTSGLFEPPRHGCFRRTRVIAQQPRGSRDKYSICSKYTNCSKYKTPMFVLTGRWVVTGYVVFRHCLKEREVGEQQTPNNGREEFMKSTFVVYQWILPRLSRTPGTCTIGLLCTMQPSWVRPSLYFQGFGRSDEF